MRLLFVGSLLLGMSLGGCLISARGGEPQQENLKPDTLLLEDRAALAINCLARNQDPARGGQPYFLANVESLPQSGYGVRAVHLVWDYGDCTGRFCEALTLARLMSGNRDYPEADARIRAFMLSLIRSDGLSWIPEDRCDHRGNTVSGWAINNTMRALVNDVLLTGNAESKRYLEQLIAGFGKIAVKTPDYWYWPDMLYTGKWSTEKPPFEPNGQGYEWATFIRGLSRYYAATHDAEAKELIEKSARFVIEKSGDFAPDGTYRTWHTHSRILMASGILHFALLEGKSDWAQWARNVFDFTYQKHCTSFGFVPERLNNPDVGAETCSVADMVELAIMLGESGHEEYWNYADRFIRNHLVESQITDISALKPIPGDQLPATPNTDWVGDDWKTCTRADDAARMQLGGFAGRSAANDIVANTPHMIQHCCTGHGTRALYIAWHHIVTKRPDAVYVNLSLSRDTPWVEVNSYHPYEGKLEIVIHNAPDLAVRIADWVAPADVRVTVDGHPATFTRRGSYVLLNGLKPSARVVVSHPLRSLKEEVKIGTHQYNVEWRGDTIVGIDPPGKILPLYRREFMKNDQTPMKKIRYHVPDQEIDW